MGELISLAARRAARAALASRPRPRVTFYFDLASPWTYLAAERVDRLFASVRWQPVLGDAAQLAERCNEAERFAAERRAAELRMPLVWPETWPATGRSALRVATVAAERGRAAPYVLAVSRLAFCGGYDLDDPEIIAEAAAAAGLGLEQCLQAAGDLARDSAPERAAVQLLRRGVDALPALAVGRNLFGGEHRLGEALAAARGRRPISAPQLREHG